MFFHGRERRDLRRVFLKRSGLVGKKLLQLGWGEKGRFSLFAGRGIEEVF
jgi:hypothetical protein